MGSRQYRTNWRRGFSRRFCGGKRQFFAGILCVCQEKITNFRHKRSAVGCRHICGVLPPGKELFQTKVKIHRRLFALLLVFALVIGLLPSVLADNEPDISAAESAEETLVESQPEESPAIAPPTQTILESDEAVEDSEMEAEDDVPTSMDGETLTRMDNDGLMLLGGGGTMGKSTCVTFAAYQSARWKCHRYEVDGSHSYGHYFYTSEIAYHTIDGMLSYCIERATRS